MSHPGWVGRLLADDVENVGQPLLLLRRVSDGVDPLQRFVKRPVVGDEQRYAAEAPDSDDFLVACLGAGEANASHFFQPFDFDLAVEHGKPPELNGLIVYKFEDKNASLLG